MTDKHALVPVEQKQVVFYGDELTAVSVQIKNRTEVFVPVRPICDFFGVAETGTVFVVPFACSFKRSSIEGSPAILDGYDRNFARSASNAGSVLNRSTRSAVSVQTA